MVTVVNHRTEGERKGDVEQDEQTIGGSIRVRQDVVSIVETKYQRRRQLILLGGRGVSTTPETRHSQFKIWLFGREICRVGIDSLKQP